MKKLSLSLTVLFLLIGTSAFAGSCMIPKFIKKGVTINFPAGFEGMTTTIAEIDKKSCWVKGDDGVWVNLNSITVVYLRDK